MKKILFLILFLTGLFPVFDNNSLYLEGYQSYGQSDEQFSEEQPVAPCPDDEVEVEELDMYNTLITTCTYDYADDNPEGDAICEKSCSSNIVNTGGPDPNPDPEDPEDPCDGVTCPVGFELDRYCNCNEIQQPCYNSCGEGYYQTLDCGCEPIPNDLPPGTCTLVACLSGYTLNRDICKCVPLPKTWYFDNDGDDWHDGQTIPIKAVNSPGNNWISITLGADCNDNDATVTNNCSSIVYYLDEDGDRWHSDTGDTKLSNSWIETTYGLDCDDTNYNLTNGCYQIFYIDNDNDGWHCEVITSIDDNGGIYKTTSLGIDCDDNDPTKWRVFDGNFPIDPITYIGIGGPVTPNSPSTADDFVYGGGNSGLQAIQPNNLTAFTRAKSGEIDPNGLNPFSDGEYWVKENLLEKTEEELFEYFENALHLLTVGETENEALGNLLNHFKTSTGEPFINDKLSETIDFGDGDALEDRSVGNFMNDLFQKICAELQELKDDCVGEVDIDLTILRYPNFPLSDPNLIAQLGGIQGVGAFVDDEGNLSAELYDTFGVSEEDAVKRDGKFGNTLSGGSIGTKAMRILQTHFGKRPFVHIVKIDPLKLGQLNFNINNCN